MIPKHNRVFSIVVNGASVKTNLVSHAIIKERNKV